MGVDIWEGSALIIVAALLTWLVTHPMRVTLHARVENTRVELRVGLDYVGLHRAHSFQLPETPDAAAPGIPATRQHFKISWHVMHKALSLLRHVEDLTDQLWCRTQVKQFDLSVRLGLPDASGTALWAGRITTAIAWWIGVRIAPRSDPPPRFSVTPEWGQTGVVCNFASIIQLRPSDIILATIASLRHKRRTPL